MKTANQVRILDEVVRISQSLYTLGKGMIPTVFFPPMGKEKGELGSLVLVRQPFMKKADQPQIC